METYILLLVIIGLLFLLLFLGVPIAFSMGGLATIFVFFTWGCSGLYVLFETAYEKSGDFLLLAIPMFIFMAKVLQTSGMGRDLYQLIYRWIGRIPGGLAIGTVIIGAICAAMAGISAVALVLMGIVALPSMLERGYDKKLALGSILGGGSLGILIPPSIIMVIYGAMTGTSIGKLFIGGVIPGLVLVVIFSAYIYIRVLLRPETGPRVAEKFTLKQKLIVFKGTILPILLIILVLGTIYGGACTPTEASAIGAFGAIVCGLVYKELTWSNFKNALFGTMKLNAMVFWLIIGAMSLNHLLAYLNVQEMISDIVLGMQLSRWAILIGVQLMLLILGMFIDPIGILMLTLPIIDPLVSSLNFDPVWFGVLFTVNMEMGFMTPPFGFNLFTLKGVVPRSISMADIYGAVYPFVALVAFGLALMMIFPQIVLWLPEQMLTR